MRYKTLHEGKEELADTGIEEDETAVTAKAEHTRRRRGSDGEAHDGGTDGGRVREAVLFYILQHIGGSKEKDDRTKNEVLQEKSNELAFLHKSENSESWLTAYF